MRFFHRTEMAIVNAIQAGGFKDAEGCYMTDRPHKGVWLSNVPLDINEGADGDTLLAVDVGLPEAKMAQYEWVEEGKPYREWLVPAAILNEHATVRIVDEEA